MKIFEQFGKDGFHTSIATTFGVDFDAYENILLARFRGTGCHNNLLVVDNGMLSFALDGASPMPNYAGKNYTVTGAKAKAVFHPKVVLQLGRKAGRMIVSSANVTASGLAGNLEVAALIECDGSDCAETGLIAAGWQYLERFLDRDDEGIRHQLSWMWSRTPWLKSAKPAEGVVKLADGSKAGFLATGRTAGVGEQFLQCIGSSRVNRLIAISPYWDDELSALSFLATRTSALNVCALVETERQAFPKTALVNNPQVQVHDLTRTDRFVHAKVFIAQTDDADHVLFGSANCTISALGDGNFAGLNEEACLYRALPPGAAVDALDLSNDLDTAPLSAEAIPEKLPAQDIPLTSMQDRFPGRFECSANQLKWWPPTEADSYDLDLLRSDGEIAPVTATRQSSNSDGIVRFDLAGPVADLAFARIRFEDGVSTPGIILFMDELRNEVRDKPSKRIDAAIGRLDGELEASLLLLEVIGEIEDAEAAQAGSARAPRRFDKGDRADTSIEDEGRTLSYEAFMAGRRLRADAQTSGRSSFGTSNMSSVRGFLNRLLSLSGNSGEGDLSNALSTSDEVADAGAAVESGASFDKSAENPNDPCSADPNRERWLRTAQRRDNREALVKAVAKVQKEIPGKARSGGLNSIDLLWLRAMIVIIATAGWDGEEPTAGLLQVLPPFGDKDGSWPRLIGKTLSAYFGYRDAAIKTLKIDAYHDQLPEDVLEFWATSMWAIHVITSTCARHGETPEILNSFAQIQRSIYQIAGLLPAELTDARITREFERLNGKFSSRLKLDPVQINTCHRQAAGTLLATA